MFGRAHEVTHSDRLTVKDGTDVADASVSSSMQALEAVDSNQRRSRHTSYVCVRDDICAKPFSRWPAGHTYGRCICAALSSMLSK